MPYRATHAVRPDVTVIGGGVHPSGLNDQYATAPDTFISNMVLLNGRLTRLETFAINPYTERRLTFSLRKRPLRVAFDDPEWLLRRLGRLSPPPEDLHRRVRLEHRARGAVLRKERRPRCTRRMPWPRSSAAWTRH
jgi:hypothetical protein